MKPLTWLPSSSFTLPMPSGAGIPATKEPKCSAGMRHTSTSMATPPSLTRTRPGRNGGPPGSA